MRHQKPIGGFRAAPQGRQMAFRGCLSASPQWGAVLDTSFSDISLCQAALKALRVLLSPYGYLVGRAAFEEFVLVRVVTLRLAILALQSFFRRQRSAAFRVSRDRHRQGERSSTQGDAIEA